MNTPSSYTWHATAAELRAYRHGAGDHLSAASVEAHLLTCEDCRRALATSGGTATAEVTERRWRALTDVIDAPQSSALSRITLSTRPLLWSWLVATGLVFVLPVLPAIISGRGVATVLLATAPLAPSAAVALAYRGSADPAGELALATPMAGFRTIAGRAFLVGLAAAPLGVLTALLLDLSTAVALAWLLPGLALSSVVLLAGTTRIDPAVVAGGLGITWATAVCLPAAGRGYASAVAADWISAPPVQLAALAISCLALALAATRRDHLTYRRTA